MKTRALCACLFAGPAAAQPIVFELIPPPTGYVGTAARAVSADGSIVVGSVQEASAAYQAMRWTSAGGIQLLGMLPGDSSSDALGISDDASTIVGQSRAVDNSRAFRWTAPGGMIDLGQSVPGGTYYAALDTTADGSTIVGFCVIPEPPHHRPFTWTNGGMVPLDIYGQAWGITPDGQYIVGSGFVGFRWNGAPLWLGAVPGRNDSRAQAISADGSVIVGYSMQPWGDVIGFRWTQATGCQVLPGPPSGNSGGAWTISADGSLIGGRSSAGVAVWAPGLGAVALPAYLAAAGVNTAGLNFVDITGMSADGLTITGNGWTDPGGFRAWYLRLPHGSLCYANCDASPAQPTLNIADFACFLNRYFQRDSRANCDESTTQPVLNILDLICFLNRFSAGCP